MKIKTKKKSFEAVMALPKGKHRNPLRPNFLLQTVIRVASLFDLAATRFTYTTEGMEQVKGQPCLILMNHSSFIDLMIASRIFSPSATALSAPATVLWESSGLCDCWAVSPPRSLSAMFP